MKQYKLFGYLALVLIIAGMVAIGCSDKKDDDTVTGPGGTADETLSYSTKGDTIFVSYDAEIRTWSYCRGDSLVTEYDTSAAGTDTVPYSVNGNTLALTIYVEEDSSLDATLSYQWILTRQGNGSGLEGYWKLTDGNISVLTGSVPDSTLQELWDETFDEEDMPSLEMVISGNQISVYEAEEFAFADDFIEQWEKDWGYGSQADDYAITVTKVNESTVEMVGDSTGNKTVTLTGNAAGDVTFASSDPDDATTTVYDEPTSCPNDEPDWYNEFMAANRIGGGVVWKGAAKAAKQTKAAPTIMDKIIRRLDGATILN